MVQHFLDKFVKKFPPFYVTKNVVPSEVLTGGVIKVTITGM
jgi:hypothetical protein